MIPFLLLIEGGLLCFERLNVFITYESMKIQKKALNKTPQEGYLTEGSYYKSFINWIAFPLQELVCLEPNSLITETFSNF